MIFGTILTGILFFSNASASQNLPAAQDLVFKQGENPDDFHPAFSDAKNIKQFRVLIFPHFGTYSVPEGRETSASQVTVTSSEPCEIRGAILDANKDWKSVGNALDRKTEIKFVASEMNGDKLYYHCTAPFVVQRESNLKSLQYTGDFLAYVVQDQVRLVHLVDPEIYLKGVVPSEVGASWPSEVLKAQAVAARTYAWWSVLSARMSTSAIYDMDDTVMFQAYLGNEKRTTDSDLSVDQTSNETLTYQDEIIKTYFSADSGGFTESSKEAFGQELAYCQAKKEEFDISVLSSWTKEITLANLRALLVDHHLIPAVSGLITNIQVTERDESGRAAKLELTTDKKVSYTLTGTSLRLAYKLRSTLFSLDVKDGLITFTGKGFGHGVGMAQIGALQYAKLGWTYDQILHFYYTNVQIQK